VTLEIHVPPAADDKDREAYTALREAFPGYDPR
jgi:hypothetical protein